MNNIRHVVRVVETCDEDIAVTSMLFYYLCQRGYVLSGVCSFIT